MTQGGVTLYDPQDRAEIEMALELLTAAESHLPFVVSGIDYVKEIETAYKTALVEEHEIRMAVLDALDLHHCEAALRTPIVTLVKALAADHAALKAKIARDAA